MAAKKKGVAMATKPLQRARNARAAGVARTAPTTRKGKKEGKTAPAAAAPNDTPVAAQEPTATAAELEARVDAEMLSECEGAPARKKKESDVAYRDRAIDTIRKRAKKAKANLPLAVSAIIDKLAGRSSAAPPVAAGSTTGTRERLAARAVPDDDTRKRDALRGVSWHRCTSKERELIRTALKLLANATANAIKKDQEIGVDTDAHRARIQQITGADGAGGLISDFGEQYFAPFPSPTPLEEAISETVEGAIADASIIEASATGLPNAEAAPHENGAEPEEEATTDDGLDPPPPKLTDDAAALIRDSARNGDARAGDDEMSDDRKAALSHAGNTLAD